MSRFLCQARWMAWEKTIYDEQISIIKEMANCLILLLPLLTLLCGLQCEMSKRLKSTPNTPKEEEAGISPLLTLSCCFVFLERGSRNHKTNSNKCPYEAGLPKYHWATVPPKAFQQLSATADKHQLILNCVFSSVITRPHTHTAENPSEYQGFANRGLFIFHLLTLKKECLLFIENKSFTIPFTF